MIHGLGLVCATYLACAAIGAGLLLIPGPGAEVHLGLSRDEVVALLKKHPGSSARSIGVGPLRVTRLSIEGIR
jgi:hypothetical protein